MQLSSHFKQIQATINSHKKITIEIDLDVSLTEQFYTNFDFLQNFNRPVLYWFECKSIDDAKELKELFICKRSDLIAVPPVNNNLSKVLYLGVRQGGKYKREKTFSKINGRIYHHFGLYKIETTQGLKLEKWATNTGKKLNLHILELDINENQYLYILEKLYALELKPMFGKH